MPRTIGSDAERLRAIYELECAILARQPDFRAALAHRNEARARYIQARKELRNLDAQLKSIETQVHQRCNALFLNGDSLDRGDMALGNEVLRFSGWRGQVEIPLASIQNVDLGTSFLPPRSGVPVLEKVWPGAPRFGGTLLLAVNRGDGAATKLAVVADLRAHEFWRDEIKAQQGQSAAVANWRSGLLHERQIAERSVADTSEILKAAQASLDVMQKEISDLKSQQNTLRAQQRQVDAARQRVSQAQRQRAKRGGRR